MCSQLVSLAVFHLTKEKLSSVFLKLICKTICMCNLTFRKGERQQKPRNPKKVVDWQVKMIWFCRRNGAYIFLCWSFGKLNWKSLHTKHTMEADSSFLCLLPGFKRIMVLSPQLAEVVGEEKVIEMKKLLNLLASF